MDKPTKPASTPQPNPELEKYSKYSIVGLCGCATSGEFREVLKYVWSKPPPPPPEPPDR